MSQEVEPVLTLGKTVRSLLLRSSGSSLHIQNRGVIQREGLIRLKSPGQSGSDPKAKIPKSSIILSYISQSLPLMGGTEVSKVK